jgi:hypothetical protein
VARLLWAYQVNPSYKCITLALSWEWRWSKDCK